MVEWGFRSRLKCKTQHPGKPNSFFLQKGGSSNNFFRLCFFGTFLDLFFFCPEKFETLGTWEDKSNVFKQKLTNALVLGVIVRKVQGTGKMQLFPFGMPSESAPGCLLLSGSRCLNVLACQEKRVPTSTIGA